MQITEVVPLDKRRSKIFLDGEVAFALYKGELKKYEIEEGKELTKEQYRQILEQVLMKRAKERALYLLKDKDRTEQELRRKLDEGFYPEAAVDKVVAFLKEYHFLDDLEYGRRYILACKNRRSRKRIGFDLRKKGLEQEQISELLQEEEVSEDSQIEAFLQKRGYTPQAASPKERGKLAAALARKGFPYEAIYRAMGEDWGGDGI